MQLPYDSEIPIIDSYSREVKIYIYTQTYTQLFIVTLSSIAKQWKLFKCSLTQWVNSVPQLCNPMDCGIPGFPVYHQLLELTQTHVHWVGDAIQPSHPLSSPSPPAFNLSQHQDLFQWISSLHQVAKVLAFQLQYQSFQWIFRTAFL